MSEHHPISDLMTETMSKIKEMVDVNTIIGSPIVAADGTTVIPVSYTHLLNCECGNEIFIMDETEATAWQCEQCGQWYDFFGVKAVSYTHLQAGAQRNTVVRGAD